MAGSALNDAKNNAEGLLYTTEKSLDEYGHVLSPSAAQRLRAAMQELRAAAGTDDLERILSGIRRLERFSHAMARAMYAAAASDEGVAAPRIRTPAERLSSSSPTEFRVLMAHLLEQASTALLHTDRVWPVAAYISREQELVELSGDGGDERDAPDTLARFVVELRALASRNACVACATCAEVMPLSPQQRMVVVELEHVDGAACSLFVHVEAVGEHVSGAAWGRVFEYEGAGLLLFDKRE